MKSMIAATLFSLLITMMGIPVAEATDQPIREGTSSNTYSPPPCMTTCYAPMTTSEPLADILDIIIIGSALAAVGLLQYAHMSHRSTGHKQYVDAFRKRNGL